MAATGYTPISLYYSTTASAAPTAGNLVNGELAINITDGKLYYKDNTGTVKVIAGAGGAGVAGGSNTQVQFNSSGSLAGSSNFTWNGTTLAITGAVTATADSAFTSTGALQLPSGTTGQQPTGVAGKIRFNTTTGTFEGYNGTTWGAIGGAPTGAYTRTDVTATGGQTTFTGLTYQVGYIQVYLNGVLLDPSDYTATSGTSVVLGTAAVAGDIVSFVVLTISSIGNAANISGGAANQIPYQSGVSTTTFNSNFVFDGTNLGVGTSSPSALLQVSKALSSTLTAGINIQNYGTYTWGIGIDNAVSNTSLAFQSSGMGGTTRMVLDSSGNLGVGTTSPASKAELSGSSNCILTVTATNDTTPGIDFRSNSVDRLAIYSSSNYGANFNVRSNQDMRFGTNNTERMRIDSSGNVLIGTTSANANLYVYGSPVSFAGLNVTAILSSSTSQATGVGGLLAFEGQYGSGLAAYGAIGGLKENSTSGNYAGYLGFYTRANGSLPAEKARLSSTGGFSVGTTADPGAGAIYATGNITAYYSDDRLKTKLGGIENALDKVKSLSGFYYEANQTAQDLGYKVKREVGVSAQQVQAVLPEVVSPAPIDQQYLTVDYERIVPLLIEAIKELEEKVAKLEAK